MYLCVEQRNKQTKKQTRDYDFHDFSTLYIFAAHLLP